LRLLLGVFAVATLAAALAAPAGAKRIVGNARANLLIGTAAPDRVVARAGNDRIDVAGGGRDVVSCGPGVDVVQADPSDRIASDCETVTRRISVDPYPASAPAQHASEVEPDSFAWGSTVVAVFQVGRFADGGALDTGFAVSRDAGRTWRRGLLPALTVFSSPPGRWRRASDPAVAYDAMHGVWLVASLVIGMSDSGIAISRSRNGVTWSAPVIASEGLNNDQGIDHDKEWIGCDNGVTSPFSGRCYVSYSDLDAVDVATRTSADGGLTWSAPVDSPDGAGRQGIQGPYAPGVQPVVLPTGTVVIPFYDGGRMTAVRSDDGGASFSPETVIAPAQYRDVPGLRSAPLPSAEVGADGAVVLAWPDCSQRPGCGANDIVVSRSTDGVTWSAPVRVPLGAGSHVIPGIAADPARPGRLAIVAYAYSAGALSVDFTSSSDAGRTWRRPRRLTARPMPLRWFARAGGAMLGDYVSTSFAGGRAVPVVVLAQPPAAGRLRESAYAASLPVG
jgi:hypothetical protein